jgi:hypothetical protein
VFDHQHQVERMEARRRSKSLTLRGPECRSRNASSAAGDRGVNSRVNTGAMFSMTLLLGLHQPRGDHHRGRGATRQQPGHDEVAMSMPMALKTRP